MIKEINNIFKMLRENQVELSLNGNNLEIVSFQEKIPAELIDVIKQNKELLIEFLKSEESQKEIGSVTSDNGYVLSPGQLRLWSISQSQEASVAYNMPATIHLELEGEVERFKDAISGVINRHEILRTVFRENETGEVMQWVLPIEDFELPFSYVDVTEADDKQGFITELLEKDASTAFDLAKGPLLRFSLFKVSNNEFLLYYNMHHIISDGWSMDLIQKEVLEIYTAEKLGKEPQLPELKIQYKDFAQWQCNEIELGNYGEHKEFWTTRLSGDLPVVDLPTSLKRPKVMSFAGKNLKTYLSPETTAALKDFCQKEKGSLFMGILALWNVLLYKYSGQKQIILGSPVSGREHTDLKDQLGFYVNTLPILNEIDGGQTFLEFFRSVKDSTLSAYKYQEYPFDKLVSDLDISKDTSRNPLFDIFLVLQNIGENGASSNRNDIDYTSIQDLGDCISKFDLLLNVEEDNGGLSVDVKFNTSVYETEMIEGLITHFKQLTSALLLESDRPIGAVDFLTENEKQELIVGFNDTKTSHTTDQTMIDVFMSQVKLVPNNEAIVFGNTSLTYSELDVLSNRLANYLREEYQVGANKLVGVNFPNCEWTMVAMLAVLKTGGAFIPIDIDNPKDRIAYIKEDSQCNVNIDSAELEKIKSCVLNYSPASLQTKTISSDLAYVIYTSGSTGKPKGVQINHVSFVNYNNWLKEANQITAKDSSVLNSSISFDGTLTCLFGPILNGGTLHVLSNDLIKIPSEVVTYITENNITFFKGTPAYLNLLFNTDEATQLLKGNALRFILTGGEKPDLSHIERIVKESDVYVINEYGPTESTVGICVYNVDQNNYDFFAENLPIGRPIYNADLFILDENQALQPKGVVGELYIGGRGLSRGYLNRPELTEEKFISHPFKEGATLYRTGDLCKQLEDGNIVFLGRIDHQVKINGHRIELEEIEKVILKQEVIDQAVVTAKKEKENQFLTAYLLGNGPIDKREVRNTISKELPSYMVPSYYVEIDSIPINNNGKVDRDQLPAVTALDLIVEEYIAPQTKEEKVLIEVLETVLNRSQIGVKDSFYNLGGDSIKSIQLVSRLRQQGYKLKIEQILNTPVLEELAQLLELEMRIIDQAPVEGNVLLTPIQNWFFEEVPVKEHYNQSILLQSEQPLDSQILSQVITHLVNHHDALRMVYAEENGVWTQYNEGQIEVNNIVEFYDLSSSKDGLLEMEQIGGELQASCNLENGPIFRVAHFRLADGDRLALIAHHLVIDGVSWRILLEDLALLFDGYTKGEKPTLPLKTDSFQLWSEKQHNYAQNLQNSNEGAYWLEVCNRSVASFPGEEESDNGGYNLNAEVSFTLDQETTELLQTKVPKVYKTEINDVLLSCLGLAIRDAFGIEETVLKMEGHGREDIIEGLDISRTVGWFTSTYPFVLKVTNADHRTALIETKDALRKIPTKGIGYGIIKYLSTNELNEINPTITFNYLGDFGDDANQSESVALRHSSDSIGAMVATENNSDTLFSINGMLVSNQLTLSISYNSELNSTKTIHQLMEAYQSNLELLIADLSVDRNEYLTSSELTFKGLSTEELEEINAEKNVEDVYELSPLQYGLYYHWLANPASSSYFEQMSYNIEIPNLNMEFVKEAFSKLINRHAILRTGFTNSYAGTLLQVVYKNVESNFQYVKLSEKENNTTNIESIKENDRSTGFNLDSKSQMRLTVLDTGNDNFEFIWSHHHILTDGWCLNLLINEFYQILNAVSKGLQIQLPTPKPYSNYIKWIKGLDINESVDYWKSYLENYNTATQVPSKIKDADIGLQHAVIQKSTLEISQETCKGINELCASAGITHNTFMQTMWGYLLSKYNNTNDVVFGLVVSGRPPEVDGIEDMIGLFINTIPVRISYDNLMTPMTLLRNVHNNAVASTANHYLSLSEIQSQSEMGMDLINHIMIFGTQSSKTSTSEDLTEDVGSQTEMRIKDINVFEQTNYDLNLSVSAQPNSMSVTFEFNNKVHDGQAIEGMKSHLNNLIEQFCAYPNEDLVEFSHLPMAEQEELVISLNNTNVPFDLDETFVNLFETQVQNTPHQVAVIYGDETYTYEELNRYSDALAFYLESLGLEREEIVGVNVARDPWLLISMIAIFKIGGAYLPIDPSYPQGRIDYLLENSQCNHVIEQDFINNFKEELDENQPPFSRVAMTGSDLAYVLYTSGSTGKPKGVMIEHSALLNHLYAGVEKFDLNEKSVIVQNAPSTFDVSVWQMLNALIVGGTTTIFSKDVVLNPEQFLKRLAKDRVTVLQTVPSYLKTLLEEDELQEENYFEQLSYLANTGEAANKKLIEIWFERYPHIKFVNCYGPAEVADDASLHVLETAPSGLIPIGKPIRNMSVYILNQDLELVGKNVEGEICVAGIGVGRGYYNNPDLTSQKFIENPFIEGERMYRTGDVGKIDRDGVLHYVGRNDHQVKIRGHRIELGEIEYQLQKKEGVKEAVVIARDDITGVNELVAYMAPNLNESLNNLRTYLASSLPDYMIPSYFMQLDVLPLTPNSKVDKNALLSLPIEHNGAQAQCVLPRNENEEVLVEICKSILKRDEVSMTDNFFSLGGDSIKIIQVISQLKQQGYQLKVNDILRNLVIEDIAKKITNFESKSDKAGGFATQLSKTTGLKSTANLMEVSKNQLLEMQNVYSHGRISPITISNFSEDTFEKQFRSFLEHYPVLRLGFELNEGVTWQRLFAASDVKLDIQIQESYDPSLLSKLEENMSSFFDAPFSLLDGGALIRLYLLKDQNNANTAYLFTAISHAITDDYSNTVIAKNMERFFTNTTLNTNYVSNFDYTSWQQQFLSSEEGIQQREFWMDSLERINWEQSFNLESNATNECVIQKRIIAGDDFIQLKEQAQELEVPMSVLFAGIHQSILSKLSNGKEGVLNILVNGREESNETIEIANVLGVVNNLIPLPVSSVMNDISKEDIHKIYEEYLTARLHQKIPFEVIKEDFKNKHNIDISDSILGKLNVQLKIGEQFNLENFTSETMVHVKEAVGRQTSNLTCVVFENAVEIELATTKQIYNDHFSTVDLNRFTSSELLIKPIESIL